MKSFLILITSGFLTAQLSAQNVGIGTASPHSSAMLDVSSTTRGLLAPRMTTAQRTAVVSPAKGLLVYDTDLNGLYHYNGSVWAAVGGGGGGFSLPYDASVNLNTAAFKITNAGTGAAIHAVTTNEFGFGLLASNTTNYGYSVYGYSRSPNAVSVYGNADSSTAVRAESVKGIGVDAKSNDSIAIKARIQTGSNANPVISATHVGIGIGVDASSVSGAAVRGTSANVGGTIIGKNTSAGSGFGVYGEATGNSGQGVRGEAQNGTGVLGYSNNGTGVSGGTLGGTALRGSSISGYGLDVSGKIKISGGNTAPSTGAVLTSTDANGNAVWTNNRIAFGIEGVNTNYETVPNDSWRKVHFAPNGFYDFGGNYNLLVGTNLQPTSSSFTAPVSGAYHFDVAIDMRRFDLSDPAEFSLAELVLKLNNNGNLENLAVNANPVVDIDDTGLVKVFFSISRDVFLNAGEIVYVETKQFNNDGRAFFLTGAPYTYFSGHLITR